MRQEGDVAWYIVLEVEEREVESFTVQWKGLSN
jgi:hypothetical protein